MLSGLDATISTPGYHTIELPVACSEYYAGQIFKRFSGECSSMAMIDRQYKHTGTRVHEREKSRRGDTQTTVPAFDAIRGQRSAYEKSSALGIAENDMDVRTHSFATGPVMAEPFISPFGLTMTPALSSK
jgi:hypothetical protein